MAESNAFDLVLDQYDSKRPTLWKDSHGRTLDEVVDQRQIHEPIESIKLVDCKIDKIPELITNQFWYSLKHIHFQDTLFDPDTCLERLNWCESLQKISITDTVKADAFRQENDFGFLGDLLQLKEVNVQHCKHIGNPGRCSLEELKELEHLTLSDCSLMLAPAISPGSLKHLDLSLNESLISLPSLKEAKQLKHLNLSGCGVAESLEELKEVPQLEYLNLSKCELRKFPEELATLTYLTHLDLSWNRNLGKPTPTQKKLGPPDWLHPAEHQKKFETVSLVSITLLTQLEFLDLSGCGLVTLPEFLCKMYCLKRARFESNRISEIKECCIKHWHANPHFLVQSTSRPRDIAKHIVTFDVHNLVKPPALVFEGGPQSCVHFFDELNVSRAKGSTIQCVSILGNLNAGKSSLIQSIKNGKCTLVPPDDRTVVLDTIRKQMDNILFNVNDFGGHEIYEVTCPLFLRRHQQVVLLVVNSSEYTVEKHDELVTKWLVLSLAYMRSGKIAIVLTHSDLCEDKDLKEICKSIGDRIEQWEAQQFKYIRKRFKTHQMAQKALDLLTEQDFPIIVTSSKSGKGLGDVEEFLLKEANRNKSVLPSSWVDMYKKLSSFFGLNKSQHYLTLDEAQKYFDQSSPLLKQVFQNKRKRLEQCLNFLHDTGVILWYSQNEHLRDIIFHQQSFLIESLKLLFHHNLSNTMKYNSDEHAKYVSTKSEFDPQLRSFADSGILKRPLLKCLWAGMRFSEGLFLKMEELLRMLDLCYVFSDVSNPQEEILLRFPWFLPPADEGYHQFIKQRWPGKMPENMLQYSIFYEFFHRIPSPIYERFCVRLHRHLIPHAYMRKDAKDQVYIEQEQVQLLLNKVATEDTPMISMRFRCLINELTQFSVFLKSVLQDMTDLLDGHPGLVTDAYFLCPHCIKSDVAEPKKRPLSELYEMNSPRLSVTLCDPWDTISPEKIPAAIVCLELLSKSFSFKQ